MPRKTGQILLTSHQRFTKSLHHVTEYIAFITFRDKGFQIVVFLLESDGILYHTVKHTHLWNDPSPSIRNLNILGFLLKYVENLTRLIDSQHTSWMSRTTARNVVSSGRVLGFFIYCVKATSKLCIVSRIAMISCCASRACIF